MFRNTYQHGFLSILYSIGSKPLENWSEEIENGNIRRITDEDIGSSAMDLISPNVNKCFITSPKKETETLGIKLPFLVMVIKNLKKEFSFEVTILDDKNVKRRFRASTYN